LFCGAVNTACEFIGQADVEIKKERGAVMLQQERYDDLKFALAELKLISGIVWVHVLAEGIVYR
jgi:hypothetical protein